MYFMLKEGDFFAVYSEYVKEFGLEGLGLGFLPYCLAVFPSQDKGGGSAFYLVP
jgi:hypothetical protein